MRLVLLLDLPNHVLVERETDGVALMCASCTDIFNLDLAPAEWDDFANTIEEEP